MSFSEDIARVIIIIIIIIAIAVVIIMMEGEGGGETALLEGLSSNFKQYTKCSSYGRL